MIKIMKAIEYMKKELSHAYKFLDWALESKAESPELFETYLKIADCEASNAENIHVIIVKMIDKASVEREHEAPKVMRDIWTWEHKQYLEEYSQFKAKLESLKKLT